MHGDGQALARFPHRFEHANHADLRLKQVLSSFDEKHVDAACALLYEISLTLAWQESLWAALETPSLRNAAEGRYLKAIFCRVE